jgi:phosphoglycerate kinase
LPTKLPIYDIGIATSMKVSSAIMNAGTVILNGPSGVFEIDDFAFGTIEIVNSCAESSAYVVMGGGHTATIVEQRGVSHKMGHVSTGGGACLNFLAGRHLPGLEGLLVSAERFSVEVKEMIEKHE